MRAVVLLCLLHAAFANFSNPWDGPGRGAPSQETNACQMDQGSCGCCLILQDVHRLKTYFNDTLAKLQRDYSLTKQSLSNYEASRSAFSVTLFSDDRFQCYGPFIVNSNIIYKHVFLNLGGSYSVDTGIFTVPRSGVYTLAVTVYSDAGSSSSFLAASVSLQVNGQVMASSSEQNADDREDSATISVVLQLQARDKVAVNLAKGSFLCENGHHNTFSAFLLYTTE